MSDERDDIRARVSIVDLVSQRVQLKKQGKDWKGLCPFHDDRNPSFTVSPRTGRYKCWSCGEGGDVFNWVMKTQNIEFPEALETLAKMAGVVLKARGPVKPNTRPQQLEIMQEALNFYVETLKTDKVALAYCKERGLEQETLSKWEIGYAPNQGEALVARLKKRKFPLSECKGLFVIDEDSSGGFFDKFRGRLMFPIRDERGDLVAFGGRAIGDSQPKYVNSSDTPLYRKSRVLYGMNLAKETINTSATAVLCEGYLDVIACHAAGVTNAVASLGTSLADEHATLLSRWCKAVVMLYDSDAAGEKAAARAVEILKPKGLDVHIAIMPQGEDPDTLLRKAGPAAVRAAVAGGLTPLDFQIVAIEKRLQPSQTEFWDEIVGALAKSQSDLEVVRHLTRLAGMYPGIRDVVLAQKALRAQIYRQRQLLRRDVFGSAPKKVATVMIAKSPLNSSERSIFGALFEAELAPSAFSICSDADVFESDQGRALATKLHQTFSVFPGDHAAVWLPKLEDPELQQLLSDCGQSDFPLTAAILTESKARLELKRETRLLRRMLTEEKDDDSRREIQERLRKLKDPV